MTSGGELDDRETSVIEDEMDRLRMGGCLFDDGINASVNLASLGSEKDRCTHKRIVSVVGIINSESGHLLPQVGTGSGEIESAEGR